MIQFGKLQFSTYNLNADEKGAVSACRVVAFVCKCKIPMNVCICSPNLIHWQHECKLLNCAMGLCVCVRVHIKHFIMCAMFARNTYSIQRVRMWGCTIYMYDVNGSYSEGTFALTSNALNSIALNFGKYQTGSFQRMPSYFSHTMHECQTISAFF